VPYSVNPSGKKDSKTANINRKDKGYHPNNKRIK
jgi:hypothetical protein